MKKTLLIVFTTLLFSQAKAQMYLIDKISLPATNEVFGFYTDINVEENDCIYFDLQTPDPEQKARAKLSSYDVNAFLSALKKATSIFVEWTQIAKKNPACSAYHLANRAFPCGRRDLNTIGNPDSAVYYSIINTYNHLTSFDPCVFLQNLC